MRKSPTHLGSQHGGSGAARRNMSPPVERPQKIKTSSVLRTSSPKRAGPPPRKAKPRPTVAEIEEEKKKEPKPRPPPPPPPPPFVGSREGTSVEELDKPKVYNPFEIHDDYKAKAKVSN